MRAGASTRTTCRRPAHTHAREEGEFGVVHQSKLSKHGSHSKYRSTKYRSSQSRMAPSALRPGAAPRHHARRRLPFRHERPRSAARARGARLHRALRREGRAKCRAASRRSAALPLRRRLGLSERRAAQEVREEAVDVLEGEVVARGDEHVARQQLRPLVPLGLARPASRRRGHVLVDALRDEHLTRRRPRVMGTSVNTGARSVLD